MSAVFKGSNTTYHVVGKLNGAVLGVGVSLYNRQSLVIRFSTLGFPETLPKHLAPRAKGIFESGGNLVAGVYFVKVTFPVTESPVSAEAFAKVCEDLEVADILAEWIKRQCELAEVVFGPPVDFAAIIKGICNSPSSEVVKPCFVLPKDLNTPVPKNIPSAVAAGPEPEKQPPKDIEIPEDLDSLSHAELCDLADALEPDAYNDLVNGEDFDDETFTDNVKKLIKLHTKEGGNHEAD